VAIGVSELVVGAVTGGFFGAVFERALAAPAAIRRHNRRIHERDASLRTWVADEDVRLGRELNGVTTSMAASGQLYSGAILNARVAAKELALHRWRDERERAEREWRAMKDDESVVHFLMRDMWAPMPELTALDDPGVMAVIDRWAEPVTGYDGQVVPVPDPRAR
jgi:hypothetical protein